MLRKTWIFKLRQFRVPYLEPGSLERQCFSILGPLGKNVDFRSLDLLGNKPFASSFYLCFKMSFVAKPFIWKWILLTSSFSCKSNSFSFEWFRTWTRFETEAKGNSDMTYYWLACDDKVVVVDDDDSDGDDDVDIRWWAVAIHQQGQSNTTMAMYTDVVSNNRYDDHVSEIVFHRLV